MQPPSHRTGLAALALTLAACHAPAAADTDTAASSTATASTPCDDLPGTVSPACADWLAQTCEPLSPSDCAAFEPLSRSVGELGCALAYPLLADAACSDGAPVCVAALHTGEGPQGSLWFDDGQVYRVDCADTALPCPAVMVPGWSNCALAADAPAVCGCAD